MPGAADGVDVISPTLGLEPLRAQERRIADDYVRLGPRRRIAGRIYQCVHGNEVFVEIVQRQGRLVDVQFVDGQLAADHHGDLRQLDGERQYVHAVKVRCGDEPEHPLFRDGLRRQLAKAFVEPDFKAFQLAVCDIEEVARPAGGIQHGEVVHPVAQFLQPLDGFRGFYLLPPRLDYRRPDDFHNIDGGGEVSTKGMPFRFIG